MSLSRRDFLKLGGLAAATATASACGVIGRQVAQDELPEVLRVPTPVPTDAPLTTPAAELPTAPVNPILRLLNRAGYGPRPGDLERVSEMGMEAYLDEQLNPEEIEDTAADLMIRNLTLYHMDVSQLVDQEPKDAVRELIGATVARAIFSQRQLYEAMVEFWSDHFNIYLRKAKPMPLLKLIDDRDVIRPHALGKFRDLLFASAKSPAMLVYLDNVRNHKEEPNENYARELLELHTLGVNAGYTQKDVQEVARALTGWTVHLRGRHAGQFAFKEERHDFGEKQVLGHTLPAGQGEEDVEQVLELLLAHPATAVFIATKLVRRFVADDPPAALVERVAETFRQTDGDVKQMLRVIFLSDEFATAPPKLKRPFAFMVSALRAIHADVGQSRAIGRWMEWLGQPLFHWPPPDGYPDVSPAWAANLLPRWNFALALVHNQIGQISAPLEKLVTAGNAKNVDEALDLFAGLTLGRPLDDEAYALFTDYVGNGDLSDEPTRERLGDAVALMLASPAFQWT